MEINNSKQNEFSRKLDGINYLLSKVIQCRDYIKKYQEVKDEFLNISVLFHFKQEVQILRSQFHNNMSILILRLFNLCTEKNEKYNLFKFHKCLGLHFKNIIHLSEKDKKNLEELIFKLENKNDVIEKIKLQRDKYYAHLDFSQEERDIEIDWVDIFEIIDIICSYVRIIKFNYNDQGKFTKSNYRYSVDHVIYYYDDFNEVVIPETRIPDISVVLDVYLEFYKNKCNVL